jgi:hypothetical protein
MTVRKREGTGSTRLHSVENSLWKRLRTSHNTGYITMMMMEQKTEALSPLLIFNKPVCELYVIQSVTGCCRAGVDIGRCAVIDVRCKGEQSCGISRCAAMQLPLFLPSAWGTVDPVFEVLPHGPCTLWGLGPAVCMSGTCFLGCVWEK